MITQSKVRKKSFTVVEEACHEIRGFRNLLDQLDDKVRLSGQSMSTLKNYSRKLAQVSLHFGKLPQHIEEKPLNKYLRRFCQHILPKGFVRIRHYGILAASKRELLRALQAAFGIIVPLKREKRTWKEICEDLLDYNPDVCPCCGKGKMITIERLLPSRGPPVQYHIVKSHERSQAN